MVATSTAVLRGTRGGNPALNRAAGEAYRARFLSEVRPPIVSNTPLPPLDRMDSRWALSDRVGRRPLLLLFSDANVGQPAPRWANLVSLKARTVFAASDSVLST